MQVRKSVLDKAFAITRKYEGTDITPVTSNFDGQFLSFGTLQWCIGQGSLQPLLKEFFTNYPDLTSKLGLDEFKISVLNGTEKIFTKNKMNNLSGSKIIEPWYTRLVNLYHTNEWQKIEQKYAQYYINKAIELCNAYNIKTDRSFCLFFDICVQQGSIPVIQLAETEYIDKLKAIALYATSRANTRWQSDVKARKLGIVYACDMGRGWDSSITFNDKIAFNDDENHWALKYWYYLNDNGVKVNAKLFNDEITRGEFFVLCARIIGINENLIVHNEGSHWAGAYWNYLNGHGINIISMDFDAYITRGAVFKILALMKGSGTLNSNEGQHWAQPYFDYLNNNGLRVSETRFEDTIIRGEAMVLLARYKGSKE